MNTDPSPLDRPLRPTTVTASGIAKMAGVGRAAVSNWRRRHSDFPAPVGGSAASPMFDAIAVEDWLRRQGKLHRVSAEEWLWRHIESVTPAADIGDAFCITGAYLLTESWHNRAGQQEPSNAKVPRLPSPRQLLAKLRSRHQSLAELARVFPPAWSAQQQAILQAAAQVLHESEQDAGAIYEYLHLQYAASSRSLSGPDATPDVVAEIMLGLTDSGSQVFDFTCGTGSILRVAAEQALRRGFAVKCYAQELKPQHALTTLLRLWFVFDRAIDAGLTAEPPIVQIGDSLLDDGFKDLTADIAIANPPFGIHDWGHERLAYDPRWIFGLPPRTEPELAWVQHALSHLATGKTAVILMPPAAAARPAGRRIRGELVRRGALRAVIALPAGMLQPAAIGLHLWVLTRPDPDVPPSPHLLFVDSAALVMSRTQGREASATSVREIVNVAWRAYLTNDDAASGEGVFCVVPAIEVLDEEVDLTPRRYLPAAGRPAFNPEETLGRARDFGSLFDEVRSGLPRVLAGRQAQLLTAPTANIADLVRSGSLSVLRGVSPTRAEGAVATGQVEVTALVGSDVVSGGPPTGRAGRKTVARVEAGDILIPAYAREVIARVATPGQIGAELGPGVHAVRVEADLLDPWFLAGVLCRSDNARIAGRASASSAGLMRIDVTRLTVPVLPIETQRVYGEAFRRLAEFQVSLGRILEHGHELARDIADGLASGVLAPEPG